jgi:chorismate mutase
MLGERRDGVRAVRGAISVPDNTREAILAAGRELLSEMMRQNALDEQELVSVLFTLTPDLDRAFPAEAARQLGLCRVPLMCMQEIAVPGAPPRILRILMHTTRVGGLDAVRHVYRGAARALRPDLSAE